MKTNKQYIDIILFALFTKIKIVPTSKNVNNRQKKKVPKRCKVPPRKNQPLIFFFSGYKS